MFDLENPYFVYVVLPIIVILISAFITWLAVHFKKNILNWYRTNITQYILTNIRVAHNDRRKVRIIAYIKNKSKGNTIMLTEAPLLWLHEKKRTILNREKGCLIPSLIEMESIHIKPGKKKHFEAFYHNEKIRILNDYKYATIRIKPKGCWFSKT